MIRIIVKPKKRHIKLDIPLEYVGKEVEITYHPLTKVKSDNSKSSDKKKMEDFWGSISDSTAFKLQSHITKSRNEWERNI